MNPLKLLLLCTLTLTGVFAGLSLVSLFATNNELPNSNVENWWSFPWFFPPPKPAPTPPPAPKVQPKVEPRPTIPSIPSKPSTHIDPKPTAPTYVEPETTSPHAVAAVALDSNWFSDENKDLHYAILIAGSKSFWNYRHQSDVCHAYQLLREHGYDDDHIITFVYDDIANHIFNPYPGEIFNIPGGNDVYHGCAKDYTGNDVNIETFYAVLSGDKNAVRGRGSERVLEPNENQKVLLVYSDHGSVGSLGMPVGELMYADELNEVLEQMVDKRHFKELVFLLESCEAGSMFDGFLQGKYAESIFVAAASNADESSWATFCPYDDFSPVSPNATYIGACLGDLFSVSWMQYAEQKNLTHQVVDDHIDQVEYETSDSWTYRYGSHVVRYGDKTGSIIYSVVANYLSFLNIPSGLKLDESSSVIEVKMTNPNSKPQDANRRGSIKQYDADLVFFEQMAKSNDATKSELVQMMLQHELQARAIADKSIRSAIRSLVESGKIKLKGQVSRKEINNVDIEFLANNKMGRPEGAQAVDDWSCLRGMYKSWKSACGDMSEYANQYNKALANLCNLGITVQDFDLAIRSQCLNT